MFKIIRYSFLTIVVAIASIFSAVSYTQTMPSKDQENDRTDQIEALKRFSYVLDLVEKTYVESEPRSKIIDGALKGMLENLDPHSSFLTKEEFKEIQENISGEFFGIGVEISAQDGNLVVISPILDAPAAKAGIQAGDVIIGIDNIPVNTLSPSEAIKRIRGAKDSIVELTILRKPQNERKVFSVKRDTIPLISVRAMPLEDYYWIRLSRFSNKTTQEMAKAIGDAQKVGAKGIILDLRNNPGGGLDQAVNVADMFLSKGTIVSIKGRVPSNNIKYQAKSQPSDVTMPVIVLVNSGSASASEIVAGALRDHKRSILVGEPTFGKGSVQHVLPLGDGSGLKLTVALYYTPNNISIQAEGITPDIIVPYIPLTKDQLSLLSSYTPRREKDLDKHLELDQKQKKSTKEESQKAKDLEEQGKQSLIEDNQLRTAVQILKSLPRLGQISS
ncbi:MAG: S41 family peptidase [Desulfovibrionaceae bacterium]